MSDKNEVIITSIEFQLNNFNGTGKNYDVEVYAQDPEESDMYGVDIVNENKSEKYYFYVDSCGNVYDDFYVVRTQLEQQVLDILFDKQAPLIKGF